MTKRYSSNLSDQEWKLIEPLLQRPHIKNGGRKNAGRKPKYENRVMINAIFYVLKSGCAWHLLQEELLPGAGPLQCSGVSAHPSPNYSTLQRRLHSLKWLHL